MERPVTVDDLDTERPTEHELSPENDENVFRQSQVDSEVAYASFKPETATEEGHVLRKFGFAIPFQEITLEKLDQISNKVVETSGSVQKLSKNEELQVRMIMLALRVLIGLVLRLGLHRVHKVLLEHGKREMEQRARVGLDVSVDFGMNLTDTNVTMLANELTKRLTHAQPLHSMPRQSQVHGDRVGENVVDDDAMSVSIRRPSQQPPGDERRFIRSRLVVSTATPRMHPHMPGDTPKTYFTPDVAWERQLRGYRSERKHSPFRKKQQTWLGAQENDHFLANTSTLSEVSTIMTAPDGNAQIQPNQRVEMEHEQLIKKRQQQQLEQVLASVLRHRSASPTSVQSMPMPFSAEQAHLGDRPMPVTGRHDLPMTKRKKITQATARRKLAQAYGNFYSRQFGRDQVMKSRLSLVHQKAKTPKHM